MPLFTDPPARYPKGWGPAGADRRDCGEAWDDTGWCVRHERTHRWTHPTPAELARRESLAREAIANDPTLGGLFNEPEEDR